MLTIAFGCLYTLRSQQCVCVCVCVCRSAIYATNFPLADDLLSKLLDNERAQLITKKFETLVVNQQSAGECRTSITVVASMPQFRSLENAFRTTIFSQDLREDEWQLLYCIYPTGHSFRPRTGYSIVADYAGATHTSLPPIYWDTHQNYAWTLFGQVAARQSTSSDEGGSVFIRCMAFATFTASNRTQPRSSTTHPASRKGFSGFVDLLDMCRALALTPLIHIISRRKSCRIRSRHASLPRQPAPLSSASTLHSSFAPCHFPCVINDYL